MEVYNERLDRMMAAVACRDVDRVPFSFSGSAVNAQITGRSLAKYCEDPQYCCDTNLEGLALIGEADSVQGVIYNSYATSSVWMSQIVLPGKGLPDNELWQIKEKEVVKQEDYDEILEKGFGEWYQQFLLERLDDPMGKSLPFLQYGPTATQRFIEAGIPNFNGGGCASPFEMFCGGRSLVAFLSEDLIEIPEKIDSVFKKVQEYNLKKFTARLSNPDTRPIAGWIGGWRGTPGMLSKEMFERFSWKYMREITEIAISYGMVPVLHLDSDWERGMEYIKQLPEKKIIVALDGQTDIFRAREALGGQYCLMGDVPSTLLAFGTPEEVTAYCHRLIKEIGPKGFILGAGCEIPYNAKLENLRAMAGAVRDI